MDSFDEQVVRTIIEEEGMTFLEGAIRRIVREELKSFMESVRKDTNQSADSDGEYDALKMMFRIANFQAEYLPHAWDCGLRKINNWPRNKCTCGVEKESATS